MGEERALRERCKRLAARHGGILLPLRGWLNGTPDALLVYNGKVTLIEFKGLKGVLSPTQIAMSARLQRIGVQIHVVRSIDDFAKLLGGLDDNEKAID